MKNNNNWKTKEGVELSISEMSNSHLLNSYLLLKKTFITEKNFNDFFSLHDNVSEEQFNFYLSCPISVKLSELEKEIKLRNLKPYK